MAWRLGTVLATLLALIVVGAALAGAYQWGYSRGSNAGHQEGLTEGLANLLCSHALERKLAAEKALGEKIAGLAFLSNYAASHKFGREADRQRSIIGEAERGIQVFCMGGNSINTSE